MRADFNKLIDEYKSKFKPVYDSDNLDTLREKYSEYSICKENIMDWIISNVEQESEESDRLFQILDNTEYKFISDYGIPVYDDVPAEEMEEIFDVHASYFQRYGCIFFDQVISWDSKSILFEDEIGNCEIITRPDVLIKQAG